MTDPSPEPADELWGWLQLELVPEDRLIRPMVGDRALPRRQAHAEIASILGRAATGQPMLAAVAQAWRTGPQDDTVFAGPFVWAIFPASGGDVLAAAQAWIDDYAATIRSATGLDVQVGRPVA